MHADGGWSKGIGGGKEKGTPVLAIHIGSVWWTSEDVVPL